MSLLFNCSSCCDVARRHGEELLSSPAAEAAWSSDLDDDDDDERDDVPLCNDGDDVNAIDVGGAKRKPTTIDLARDDNMVQVCSGEFVID